MRTPKAFTPAYGPNDEKVVWTLDGDSVLRNSEQAFDLGSVTAATLHRSRYRGDSHRFEVVANADLYVFSTGLTVKVDTDGWHWFTVSTLRRLQVVTPALQVDVRKIYADPSVVGIWSFYVAALVIIAFASPVLLGQNWSGFASFLAFALLPISIVVGLLVRRWRNRDLESKACAVPEDAANLVVYLIKRRYRH